MDQQRLELAGEVTEREARIDQFCDPMRDAATIPALSRQGAGGFVVPASRESGELPRSPRRPMPSVTLAQRLQHHSSSCDMTFRTISIGRQRDSEIRLGHASVSRQHAELTLTDEGRLYLTDRGSLRGTWVLRAGEWIGHRQGFVGLDERLRFGRYDTRLRELLRDDSFDVGIQQPRPEPASVRPRRNPGTGEVEV